jgi:GDP-L-fucose synthase
MSRLTALVSGGCGFVGRHFVKWLLDHDYTVTVVDNLSTGLAPERWPAHLGVLQNQKNPVVFHIGKPVRITTSLSISRPWWGAG